MSRDMPVATFLYCKYNYFRRHFSPKDPYLKNCSTDWYKYLLYTKPMQDHTHARKCFLKARSNKCWAFTASCTKITWSHDIMPLKINIILVKITPIAIPKCQIKIISGWRKIWNGRYSIVCNMHTGLQQHERHSEVKWCNSVFLVIFKKYPSKTNTEQAPGCFYIKGKDITCQLSLPSSASAKETKPLRIICTVFPNKAGSKTQLSARTQILSRV